MNFLKKLRLRNKQTMEINTTDPPEKIAAFFGLDEDSNENLKSATYYACMRIRCNSIAKLPLKLMKRSGDSVEPARSHSIYQLVHSRPNPYMTWHDFIWATEFQKLTYGNAFWYPYYESGKIKALYLLDSSDVTIIIDNLGVTETKNRVFYQYVDSISGIQYFTGDELCHFKNFAGNGISGTAVSKYLSDIVQNEQQANKVLKNKYRTGLQDPVIVQYVGDLNEDKQKKIIRKFADLSGVKNAGKVIPIPPDYKVSQLETKLVNSQFFELQGLTTKHIANAFGVKSFQLNDLEKSTYANIENQNRAYYSDTMMNNLTEYEQEIDYKLLTTEEQEMYFFKFNVDAFLRSDPETRYKNYQIGISSGFLMPSEVRGMEDLPFVSGTDRLIYGNGAAIPLDQVGIQYGEGGE